MKYVGGGGGGGRHNIDRCIRPYSDSPKYITSSLRGRVKVRERARECSTFYFSCLTKFQGYIFP